MKLYTIKIENTPTPIIKTIIDKLKIGETEAKKLIIQGSVWNEERNKRLKNESIILKNETIFVVYPRYPINEFTLNPEDIKYEDEDMMIVFKEHGVNTCPTPFSDIDCLTHGVQKYLNNKKIDYPVYTINRLDKPTGGLVFFAKNKHTEIVLHKMFKNRKIKKFYLCVTDKFNLQKESFRIKDTLQWKGKSYKAFTYIKFIKEISEHFYFFVYPMTGRTHQIRKHFKKHLTHITGDCLYGDCYTRDDKLMLLCYGYKFIHPYTNEKIYIEHITEDFKCIK
jgi:23S rRNA-/tRNA-specific pseudouridylate synthase